MTGPILKFFEQHYNTAYPLPKSGGCWGSQGTGTRLAELQPCVGGRVLLLAAGQAAAAAGAVR